MPSSARLPRVLGTAGVTVLSAASMGPAYSLATTMGPMVAAAGDRAPLALGLLALLMLAIAVGFGRLARTHPHAGSSYGWAEAAFGRGAGGYAAWLLLLSNVFAVMATALPAGIYTLALVAPQLAGSPLASAVVGVGWIVASAALLAAGLRPTARASALFLIAEVAVLAASALAVVRRTAGVPAHPGSATILAAASAAPAGDGGLAGFAAAMVLGIYLADGWEISASASEETTEARASERGGIAGLVLTTAVLLLGMNAYLRLGAAALAAHQTDVLAYVGDALGGGVWRVTIAGAVLLSTAATLWATMLYLSRSVFAMGRSGVLPRGLGGLDAAGAPRAANLGVAACAAVATLATGLSPTLARAIALVLGGTSVFLGALFVLSVAAGVRLAPRGDRFAAAVVPALGGAGLCAVIVVALVQGDPATRAVEAGGLLLGLPFAAARSARRPSAKVKAASQRE